MEEVEKLMQEQEGVIGVHHIHVWAISTTENALTAHLVIESAEQMDKVKRQMKDLLRQHGIAHATLEFELQGSECPDCQCC